MDPKDALLNVYQEEIQFHQIAIQDVKSKMNLLLPISKLPPEVMTMIFFFVKSGQSFRDIYCRKRGTWISEITHVCRHWRNMALNAPTLWNDPSKYIPKLAAFLERSKNTALYIDWMNLSSVSERVSLEQLVPHTSRIKNLRLHWQEFTDEDEDTLLRMSSYQLGSLEVLDLSRANVPDALLTETNALRELHLSDCGVKWDSLYCDGLQHLSLCNLDSLDETSPRLSRVLSMIGKATSLTSLTLKNAFLANGEVGSPRVHLASLKTFALDCDLTEAIPLLQSISFPRTAKVNISTELHDDQYEDIKILFAAIKGSHSLAPEEVAYLSFSYLERDFHDDWDGPQVDLSLFTKAIDVYSPEGCNVSEYTLPKFTISLKWKDRDITTPGNVRGILAAFLALRVTKMDTIRHVYLESNMADTYSDSANLASTIGRLPAVSDILAVGGMMQTLSKALKYQNSRQYSFPKLTTLSLVRDEEYAIYEMEENYDFDVNILIDSLRHRKKDNVGVRKVGFDNACRRRIIGNELPRVFRLVGCVQLIEPYRSM